MQMVPLLPRDAPPAPDRDRGGDRAPGPRLRVVHARVAARACRAWRDFYLDARPARALRVPEEGAAGAHVPPRPEPVGAEVAAAPRADPGAARDVPRRDVRDHAPRPGVGDPVGDHDARVRRPHAPRRDRTRGARRRTGSTGSTACCARACATATSCPPTARIDVLFHEFMADDVAMVERIYDAQRPADDARRPRRSSTRSWPPTRAASTAASSTTCAATSALDPADGARPLRLLLRPLPGRGGGRMSDDRCGPRSSAAARSRTGTSTRSTAPACRSRSPPRSIPTPRTRSASPTAPARRAYASLAAALADGGFDAALIAVPHHLHEPVAIEALARGPARAAREAARADPRRVRPHPRRRARRGHRVHGRRERAVLARGADRARPDRRRRDRRRRHRARRDVLPRARRLLRRRPARGGSTGPRRAAAS